MKRYLLLLLLLVGPTLAEPPLLWSEQTDWGTVLVRQEGDARILLFRSDSGETEESRISVRHPHRPVVPYVRQMLALLALWEADTGSLDRAPRFLVVGLGGASLSNALSHIFPKAEVVSVEIEPVVVRAARDYFFYRESDRVQTVIDDARSYLEETGERFDLIFLDAFDGTGVPPSLRTVEFARLLERRLTPEGAVIANIHFTPREPSLRYQKSLSMIFPYSYITVGTAQGVGLFSRHAVSRLHHNERLDDLSRRYELPLNDLLQGRHQEDLDHVTPFRDLR